jgi:osmotically-inducible protein OsmY
MVLSTVKTDVAIQLDVMDELDWDPEVEVTDVGIEVDDGIVTLTGTVDTFHKKFVAERAAFRVEGVRAVANDIVVNPGGLGYRTDTELAAAVARAIEGDSLLPAQDLDIRVADGNVTLSGEVRWNHQRTAAEKIVNKVQGVRSVTNLITLRAPIANAEHIHQSIENAIVRSAELDAENITVKVDMGEVALSGSVHSWAAREEAESVAWKAAGVTRVTNDINISPRRS